MSDKTGAVKYTCAEYRSEMILMALLKRLEEPGLGPDEKKNIQEEIRRLENEMGL